MGEVAVEEEEEVEGEDDQVKHSSPNHSFCDKM